MKTHIIIITFLLLLDQTCCLGQRGLKKIKEYMYTGGCDTKTYKREYLNDSIFVEKYADIQSKVIDGKIEYRTTLDTFKVIKGVWYYQLQGKFEIFFSPEKFNRGEITKRYYNHLPDTSKHQFIQCIGYKPYIKKSIRKKTTYIFNVNYNGCNEQYFSNRTNATLYFDPLIGVIQRKFFMCDIDKLKIISIEK